MKLTERIQSRKFLMALGAIVFFAVTAGEAGYASITQIVLGYLAVTAAQDALNDWQSNRTNATEPKPVSPAVHDDGDDEEVSGWTGSVI